MKAYEESHQQGHIFIEKDLKQELIKGDIGIQIAIDGRIWICINNEAIIRFTPLINGYIPTKGKESN